jgi:phosphate/sulfate permease
MTIYIIIISFLFLLAVSDLIVGVSNDAVNFLNSAVGSKAARIRTILIVAALGVVVGSTFSSGMMEVARKGIFHPEHFYFSEIMLVFLAVMVTDVILLDTFNSFGMPTSTTVSIVFELLGAAVAISVIKIYQDPNGLGLNDYINSASALAIISGILLSVVVAFTSGMIIQYLSRMLFSFDYGPRMKYFAGIWGGLAITAITYFILVKGAKGASFMSDELKSSIMNNSFMIILYSFIGWTIILQLVQWFTKWNILKFIVLVGTFALAMAFAGNDLVNFIGVPLAGFNSYQLFVESGGADPSGFLMNGLAGKVPTPTLLLLLSGAIMVVTLWKSKKAKRVIQTSLDLGRQYEGTERFESYAVSRSLVRNVSKFSTSVNKAVPVGAKKFMERQFNEKPFTDRQIALGDEAPSFDLIRAAVTLLVASILISIGTTLKLPLSTTYVTFMVFMGTSLADGAWGRESAVYRVSGVLSVIGGWFFTAFSAFVVAFVAAVIFYYGGLIAIIIIMALSLWFIIRSHRHNSEKLEEQLAFERSIETDTMDRQKILDLCVKYMGQIQGRLHSVIEDSLLGLRNEDLKVLNKASKRLRKIDDQSYKLKMATSNVLDRIHEEDMEAGHLLVLVSEYLGEISKHVRGIVRSSLEHIDNNHRTLTDEQVDELINVNMELRKLMEGTVSVFENPEKESAEKTIEGIEPFVKLIRSTRKTQLKRIKNHEVGTKNAMLYLNHLSEFRNLALFSNRMVQVCYDIVIDPENPQQ